MIKLNEFQIKTWNSFFIMLFLNTIHFKIKAQMQYIIKFTILLITLLLLGCNNTNTTKTSATNDSIKKFLEIAKNDTVDFKIRDKYNLKAFNLLDLSKNDSVLRNNLSKITRISANTQNFSEYTKFSKPFFEKSSLSKDTLNLARHFRYKAGYFRINNIYDSSFYYFLKSEKYYKLTSDYTELSRLYLYISLLLHNVDDNIGEELYITKSDVFYKKKSKKDLHFENHILTSKGNLFHNLKNYDLAIFYHKQALNITRNNNLVGYNNTNLIGMGNNNLGNAYGEKKEHKKAIYYFTEGLKEKNLLKEDPELYALLLNNVGYCYLNIKDYSQLPNLFIKAESIFDSLNIQNERSTSNIYLSNYYCKIKDTIKAINYCKKSLLIAKNSKANNYYLIALNNAGSIDKKNAPKYLQEYSALSEDMLYKERIARNQFYNIQLQTNEITKEKEKAIKQKWVITSIIASVLLIVILLFIVYRQRAKNKEFLLVQDQQKANESFYQLLLNQNTFIEKAKNIEKKRIALELHDNILNKLASTRFNLFTISKKTDLETISNALVHVEKIKDIEDEIRNISHNLSTDVFSQSNTFNALLENLIIEQTQLQTIKIHLEIDETLNWDTVSSKIKMNLYRIIQEVVHNINKHSQALKGTISIVKDVNNICMSIQDNGIGFNTAESKPGIGLKNIQERVFNTNGKITIQSSASGTSIFIVFPM